MRDSEGFVRMRTLQCVVLFVFLLIGGRLAYIQLVDSRYNELAKANVLRHVVQYPPRGEVFDRNGEYLVQSRECYDLMVIYSEIDKKGFDTLRMCEVLGLSREKLEKELANARMRPRAPRVVTSYISKEDKLRFDECNFRGFYAVYRTVRRYPRKVGGNLLGFVGEVNADFLKRHPDYKSGDYVGMSGVESAYEPLLKGKKGVKIQEIDTHGAIKGSYMNGVYDSLPEPGRYLVSTIDARLQLLGEEHIYHGAAVTYVYGGNNFECEGFMGMMNAILLTYLGTLVSQIFRKVQDPWKCVRLYFAIGASLLLCAGLLCGFRQFDGYMPINKNKWNTSFIAITGGTGFCVFGLTYMLVDVLKVWSGCPYRAVGMNSILIYVVHEFLGDYIPFSWGSLCEVRRRYKFQKKSHWTTMINSYVLGVGMWILIANEFYRQGVFFKICCVCNNKEG